MDFVDRRQCGGHQSVVGNGHVGHFSSARAHGLERLAKPKGACRHQGAVFAQAVTHHQVRSDSVCGQEPRQGQVGCEYGRLGDRGLSERLVGFLHGAFVVGVDEDNLAQWLSEQRLHHVIRFSERLCDDRLHATKLAEHVDVLRPLSRVEERRLLRRTGLIENTLRPKCLPYGRVVRLQTFGRALCALGEFGGIAEIDAEALARREVRRGRRLAIRGSAGIGFRDQRIELLCEVCRRLCTNQHRAPQWGLVLSRRAARD